VRKRGEFANMMDSVPMSCLTYSSTEVQKNSLHGAWHDNGPHDLTIHMSRLANDEFDSRRSAIALCVCERVVVTGWFQQNLADVDRPLWSRPCGAFWALLRARPGGKFLADDNVPFVERYG